MAQTDITPVTNPVLGGGTQPNGIHLHSPNGVSAGSADNPSDFPAVDFTAVGPSPVSVKVNGAVGQQIRFANPA
jgi:hypothetical protein